MPTVSSKAPKLQGAFATVIVCSAMVSDLSLSTAIAAARALGAPAAGGRRARRLARRSGPRARCGCPWVAGSSEQGPLAAPPVEVAGVCSAGARQLRDLGDGHVPPALAVGRVREGVRTDVD